MIGLLVRSNFAEAVEWLNALATKQVPFATAKALTRTAQDAQTDVRAGLPQHFELRSHFVEQGIRIVPAQKRDWPHPRALVGSKDEFMALQETGGKKVPKRGARNVAIPTAATIRRRGAGGRLPKGAKPRAILSKPSGFVSDHVIRKRQARKTSGTETLALFILRREATIRPRFQLRKTVEATVARVYRGHFRDALQDAIKVPRHPGRLK